MDEIQLTQTQKDFLKSSKCEELLRQNDFDSLYELLFNWAKSTNDATLLSEYSQFFYDNGIQLEYYMSKTYPDMFKKFNFKYTPVFNVADVKAGCFSECVFKNGIALNTKFIVTTGIMQSTFRGKSTITSEQLDRASIYDSTFNQLQLNLDATHLTKNLLAIVSCQIDKLTISVTQGSLDNMRGLFGYCKMKDCYIFADPKDYNIVARDFINENKSSCERLYFNNVLIET